MTIINIVNPGLINPKQPLNWEGTIKVSDDYWTIGGVPPN